MAASPAPRPVEALWPELVKLAVVGTEGRAFPSFHPPEELAPFAPPGASSASAATPEAALLAFAGVLASWREAGSLPPAASSPAPEPAPPEDLRPLSTACERRLTMILEGNMLFALPEWLREAAARGRAVPFHCIPTLVESRMRIPGLARLIAPVLGSRGRWLVDLNGAWRRAFVFDDDDEGGSEADWTEGAPSARKEYFARLRAADPARARALLEATWKSEPAAMRADLVREFAGGLSPDDEDFLERALTDKSKEVRGAAVETLAGLPTSRLAERMRERVASMCRYEGLPLMKKLVLDVLDPADPRWKFDAFPDSIHKMAEPSPTLQRRLAELAPLDAWQKATGLGVRPLIEALHGTKKHLFILRAWAEAAAREGNDEWIEALLDPDLAGRQEVDRDALFAAASERVRPRILEAQLGRANGFEEFVQWLRWAVGSDDDEGSSGEGEDSDGADGTSAGRVIPDELLRQFLAKVVKAFKGRKLESRNQGAWHYHTWVWNRVAVLWPVRIHEELTSCLTALHADPGLADELRAEVDKALSVFQFRVEMVREMED